MHFALLRPAFSVLRNFVQDLPATRLNKYPCQLLPKLLPLLRTAYVLLDLPLDMALPIERRDGPHKPQPPPVRFFFARRGGQELAVHADGHAAPTLEHAQERALGEAAPRGLPVRERIAQPARLGVVRAYLDRQRALPDGVEQRRRYDVGRHAVAEAEAHEAGFGEDQHGVWSVGIVEFCETCVTVMYIYIRSSAPGEGCFCENLKDSYRLPRLGCVCSLVRRAKGEKKMGGNVLRPERQDPGIAS